MNFFNRFLKSDPTYINVKDTAGIIHLYLVAANVISKSHIKIKFEKFRLMENKEHFYKAQRKFHVLYRFIQKVKMNKFTTVYDVDCDLRLAPLEPHTRIELVENRCLYKFNIYDLIHVITTALYQQYSMISNPQFPKNPYTNLNFSKNNLYNIYIQCLTKHICIPDIFRKFFVEEFDLDSFIEKHKMFLLESAIDNYFSPDLHVSSDIFTTINQMFFPWCISINFEFPRDKLYSIFRPYLRRFARNQYLKKQNEIDDLTYLLQCFELYNPLFGTKYIINATGEYGFDDRHLPFQELKNGVFKHIRGSAIFHKCRLNRKNYDKFDCISLRPLSNVTYIYIHYNEDPSDTYEIRSRPFSHELYEDDSEEDYDF
jgi:hypothetical protein